MNARLKWSLVIIPCAILAFLGYPMMPLGSILWALPANVGEALTMPAIYMIGLLLMFLLESTAYGVAVAFLIFGSDTAKRVLTPHRRRAMTMLLTLTWVTGIWPFHTYAHMHFGDGGPRAELIIDYSFHTTIYVAGAILVYSILSIFRERGAKLPTLTQILTIALPIAALCWVCYPSNALGQILWPPAPSGDPGPTAVQMVFYQIDWLMQSLCTGTAIAILVRSRSVLSGLPAAFRSNTAIMLFGALWMMGNWAPHVWAHQHYGAQMPALLIIEFVGHVSQYVLAVLMMPRFLRLAKEQGLRSKAA